MRRIRRWLWLSTIAGLGVAVLLGLNQVDAALGTGRLIVGFGAGLVIGVGGFFGFIVHSERRAIDSVRLRQPPMPLEPTASYDWKVVALDGAPFHLETVKGGILFLNIWSTRCPPCIAELPSIERLQKAVAAEGVTFICVATDSDPDRVREFASRHGSTLPIFVLCEGDLPAVFDSDYIPATYVVSPDGTIVYQHTGAAQWDHPRAVSFLRALALKHGLGDGDGERTPEVPSDVDVSVVPARKAGRST
jgi:thiol-disulfide isomerase/thioredoxin